MLQKGDLSMGNKTLTELVIFLDGLEEFLKNSNPNLGRKSIKRVEFIETIMNKVRNFVGDPEAEQEKAPQKTQSRIRDQRMKAMDGKVLRMEPNEQVRKQTHENDAAIMTKEASMKADEELGNPHNMTEGE